MQIKHSSAIQVVFDFLPEQQVLSLQQLSHKFYHSILPMYINNITLGLHTNKLFSYGIDEDTLFVYDTEERLWDDVQGVQFNYPKNSAGRYLNHSAQIVAMHSKVYLIAGSVDKNYNELSNQVKCWDLVTNIVTLRKPMPYKQLDFSTCCHKQFIYCVGGCVSFFFKEIPRNAVYDTHTDTWTMLPPLHVPKVYTDFYQRLALTMHRDKLLAFWLQESSHYVYAILCPIKLAWQTVEMKQPCLFSDQVTHNQMAIAAEGRVIIFGGFGSNEGKYLNQIQIVDIDAGIWQWSEQNLKLGDMFYYNQRGVSRFGRPVTALLGKEHVHYLNLATFKFTGILEDDGDSPNTQ